MAPEVARADTQSAKPDTPVATTKAKRRQSAAVRFPARFHMAITIEMANSLRRLTGGNSFAAEADIGRWALNAYLMANDPAYLRAMTGGNSNE
jgi:hypothetical protein